MIHRHFHGRFSEWHITIALWVNSKQSFSCFSKTGNCFDQLVIVRIKFLTR